MFLWHAEYAPSMPVGNTRTWSQCQKASIPQVTASLIRFDFRMSSFLVIRFRLKSQRSRPVDGIVPELTDHRVTFRASNEVQEGLPPPVRPWSKGAHKITPRMGSKETVHYVHSTLLVKSLYASRAPLSLLYVDDITSTSVDLSIVFQQGPRKST